MARLTSFTPYVVKQKTGVDRGHREDCQHVNNFGPPCECDGIDSGDLSTAILQRQEVISAMQFTGWELDDSTGLAFYRRIGEHVVYVGKVLSGWQHRWQRTSGMTLTESSGFGTPEACVKDLWEWIACRSDDYYETQRQLYAYMKACSYAPAPPPSEPFMINGIPVVNCNWECPRCGATWTVAQDIDNPRCIHCAPPSEEEIKRMHLQVVPKEAG